MDLIRWEPNRSQVMRHIFSDLFDVMGSPEWHRRRRWEEGGIWSPAIDLIDQKDKFIAKVELPGVDKKDIKISLIDNNLTIQGEIEKDENIKREDYYCCERVYGKFSRSITLPSGIDQDNIKANYKDGILEISLPKKPEEKPKEITIKAD